MKYILIIDDDQEDAVLLVEAIAEVSPGCRCHVSNSFESAKELLEENSAPDYIFLDALMYPVGGKETLNLLSQMEKLIDTVIIMNSGFITQPLADEFIGLGADRVLQKPSDYQSLRTSVKEILFQDS
jgi:DNA-binding NtrC family response regulator